MHHVSCPPKERRGIIQDVVFARAQGWISARATQAPAAASLLLAANDLRAEVEAKIQGSSRSKDA